MDSALHRHRRALCRVRVDPRCRVRRARRIRARNLGPQHCGPAPRAGTTAPRDPPALRRHSALPVPLRNVCRGLAAPGAPAHLPQHAPRHHRAPRDTDAHDHRMAP
ncbi:hypothetical protein ACFPRL_03740 [Pseudoclavibacter helvolus]